MKTSIYPGEAFFAPQGDVEKARIQDMAELKPKIQALYDAGAPLFPRHLIQDIRDQLRRLNGTCGKVIVRGFDGNDVELDVETGHTIPFGPEKEFVIGDPFIHYSSIQQLTFTDAFAVPRLAYCSLRIYHHMRERNKFSKELLDPIPSQFSESFMNIFKMNRRLWEESEQCKRLITSFQSISFNIRQIIAFAFGSIQTDTTNPPCSSFQHALILTLRRIISQRQGHAIFCYAQDPAYSEIDKSILTESGVVILDDPDGFLKVDETTLVLSFAAQAPVKQIVLELARPSMIIWDRDNNHKLNVPMADPESRRTCQVIRDHYETHELPLDKDSFSNAVMYLRRPDSGV